MNYQLLDTPIGTLRLVCDDGRLVAIEFEGQYALDARPDDTDAVLTETARQLREYFNGKRQHFDLPLAPGGTDFQRTVWRALRDIPYGEVRSYRDIALAIGRASAVRAVGAANGRNPVPIVVPCHRVIGSDGSLTGFAGGLDAKKRLLQCEGALPR
ncbi:MAG: methylated-DNA--[protein]-cysteine S-methyltransferase [Halioglobus sp.]